MGFFCNLCFLLCPRFNNLPWAPRAVPAGEGGRVRGGVPGAAPWPSPPQIPPTLPCLTGLQTLMRRAQAAGGKQTLPTQNRAESWRFIHLQPCFRVVAPQNGTRQFWASGRAALFATGAAGSRRAQGRCSASCRCYSYASWF